MSWLATKYAWKCRDVRVKGSVRLVLLALASLVRYRRITTTPTSLTRLQWLTFLSKEQLRRCLDTLETVGEIRRLSRGKNAVYGLPKMAGPLFAIEAEEKPVKMTDFVIDHLPPKTGQDDRKKPVKMTGKNRASALVPVRTSVRSEDVRTEVRTTPAAVEAFLTWFLDEYPRQRQGVLYHVNPEVAERVVRELLEGRTLEQLQAIACAMFQERRDQWILASDYSLHVLKHKATYLEGRVLAAPRAPAEPWHWQYCPHTPKCGTFATCNAEQAHEQKQVAG